MSEENVESHPSGGDPDKSTKRDSRKSRRKEKLVFNYSECRDFPIFVD